MIQSIDITSEAAARQVLAVQLPAYRVEAELIGSDDIPPLKDTAADLMACGEIFYGYYSDGALAGAISYKKDGSVVDIHRMIVHPAFFRRGIAQALLGFVLQRETEAAKFIVATGADNAPARALYAKNGFKLLEEREVAPGLALSFFEKKR
ncbi:GNAT family N-acetyltransferase [Paenibacillus arenilitoris]|uniref:GNAT family N-acetyltransferase n=1 Tax=Paenibacillus arenilitoris TaxID=2772299 RepID=A0A927CHP2_9BACL|nr:GNAT family N-acetyltransferase [Paenibacillus arenilitoris]MBD2868289.1 GNAT family N-acetyltransferase [Paenibacillus arenilitoris]